METSEKDLTPLTGQLTEIEFVVPVGPSVNHLYGKNRFGRDYLNAEGKAYVKVISGIVRSSGKRIGDGFRCEVEIKYFLKDRRRRDLDNVLKCLLDSFTKCGFWKDDDIINFLSVRRMPVDRENPRFEIKITQTEENPYGVAEKKPRRSRAGKGGKPKEGS
jgi:crossover junction endodeoxyribonuclease RusA